MKGFRKLSSIALLLCAFMYPPSLAEAKNISLSNARNEQSAIPEANLVGDKTGELLIAQRRPVRRRIIQQRRQQFRRRQIIQQRQQQFRRRQIIQQRQQQFRRRQIIRGR